MSDEAKKGSFETSDEEVDAFIGKKPVDKKAVMKALEDRLDAVLVRLEEERKLFHQGFELENRRTLIKHLLSRKKELESKLKEFAG